MQVIPICVVALFKIMEVILICVVVIVEAPLSQIEVNIVVQECHH